MVKKDTIQLGKNLIKLLIHYKCGHDCFEIHVPHVNLLFIITIYLGYNTNARK